MEKKKNHQLDELLTAILSLHDLDEAHAFFRDLCTLSELTTLAERWQVAQLLNQGKPYREISELTGASTTTVTRVAQWLNNGSGGYRLLLTRLKKNNNSEESSND